MGCVFCQEEEPLGWPDQPCGLSQGDACSPCRNLKAIEAQLTLAKQKCEDAEKEYTALVKQRQVWVAETNRAHDPLIRRLPPEIVSLIFENCSPPMTFDAGPFFEDEYTGADETWADIKALLTLAAICRNWRHVAWSTPQLWRSILVRLDSPKPKRYVGIIKEWLTRSGRLPLSIRLYCDRDDKCSPQFLQLIDFFKLHSTRWQMLDLQFIPARFVHRFHSDVKGPSILRSVRLQSAGGFYRKQRSAFNLWPDFGCRPVHACFWDTSYKSLADIHWDIVNWVQIDNFTLNECLQLLVHAPQMKHCQFGSISDIGVVDPSIPSSILRHDQVEEFSFISIDMEYAAAFFSRVSFPSLKSLVLQDMRNIAVDPIPQFLRRSSCQLEALAVIDTDFSTDFLTSLVRQIPSLINLKLSSDGSPHDAAGNHAPEVFLKLIAETSMTGVTDAEQARESVFLPKLQSLTMDYFVAKEMPWSLFALVFGPLSQLSNPLRRPLKRFYTSYYVGPNRNTPSPMFDRQSTIDLLHVLESGLEFRMTTNFDRRKNLLDAAIEYHGIRSCSLS